MSAAASDHEVPAWRALATRFLTIAAAGTGTLFASGQIVGGIVEALVSPWVALFVLAMLAALLGALVLRAWPLAVFAGGVWVWCIVTWLPPVLASPAGGEDAQAVADTARRLRVVEVNVNGGTAPDAQLIQWIKDTKPDVLVVVELTEGWQAALDSELPELPGRHAAPAADASGIGLYSRFPIVRSATIPSPVGAFNHIDALMQTPVGPVRLLAVHLLPPISVSFVGSRNSEMQWLAQLASTLTMEPLVVVGDFNETPWGNAYSAFVQTSHLRSARDGWGIDGTWHRNLPAAVRIPIDHCFISRGLGSVGFENGPVNGSDHLPIVADLVVLPPPSATLPE